MDGCPIACTAWPRRCNYSLFGDQETLAAEPKSRWLLPVFALVTCSGAAIGTQVSAAIAFLIAMLAAVDNILVSYLAAPAKTQAALQLLHDAC